MEYVRSVDLLPVLGPKARATGLVAGLDSRDWVMVCEALNDARCLTIHHPVLLAPILIGRWKCAALPGIVPLSYQLRKQPAPAPKWWCA